MAIAYVVATCKADTPLMAMASGVYEGNAPIGTAFPYVLVAAPSPGVDSLSGNRVRLMTRVRLQIKAVGYIDQGAYANLTIIANRIDALFGNQKNPATGILCCYREQEIKYPDPKLVSGRQVQHKGGLYDFELASTLGG